VTWSGTGLTALAVLYFLVTKLLAPLFRRGKGVFTFEGGTDKLIGIMAANLQKNGVTICTKAKAERILVDKGRVRGVFVNGREITAKSVVSNSGITNTIDNLAGSYTQKWCLR
jgi:phytoene dehydrogenase-like protein